MDGSVATAQEDDGRIVIYQSTNREGSTFSLSPATRRTLQARFGDKLQASPRIFVAHGTIGDLDRLHGRLAAQLIALLTGFDHDLIGQIGDFEFRDPVTDQRV
jgi:hypothetical protein